MAITITTTTTITLPVDILRLALPYMTLKSRLQLADTCRYWREFLLNEWEDMWDTIVIVVTCDNKDDISNADLNRVLLHAPRDKIRHLSFRSSDDTYTIDDTTLGYKDIGSRIVKHGCQQIETMVYDVQKDDMIEAWFGELIMMNKEALKRVWLKGNLSASNAKAWLSTLLITCSKLQELCCMATHLSSLPPAAPIEIGLPVQLPPHLPLTRLALSTIELTSALPAIVSQCPHLEELVFDESHSSPLLGGFDLLTNDILEQVDQYCPNIKHISINTAYRDDPFEHDAMSRDGPGLKVLKCMMIPPAGYNTTLQKMIDKHYTTLHKLVLRIGKPVRIMDTQAIPPLVFPGSCQRLRYLTLHDSPNRIMQSYTSRKLCDLLRACPCLDSLSLKSHALYETDVYATLASMMHTTESSTLRHLYLKCPTSISVREKDDYQHVSQSISDLFETQGAARLQTIELHLGGLMNDGTLESVGNECTSLSRLVIGRSNALTVAGIITWAQHTQQTRLTHASFHLYDDQSVMNSSENLLLITMALSLLPQLIDLNLAHPTVTYKEAKEHLLRFCILSRSKWRPKITYSGFNPTTGPFTTKFRLQGKRSCDITTTNEWKEYSCQEWWDKSPKPTPITVHYDHQKHRVHMGRSK